MASITLQNHTLPPLKTPQRASLNKISPNKGVDTVERCVQVLPQKASYSSTSFEYDGWKWAKEGRTPERLRETERKTENEIDGARRFQRNKMLYKRVCTTRQSRLAEMHQASRKPSPSVPKPGLLWDVTQQFLHPDSSFSPRKEGPSPTEEPWGGTSLSNRVKSRQRGKITRR